MFYYSLIDEIVKMNLLFYRDLLRFFVFIYVRFFILRQAKNIRGERVTRWVTREQFALLKSFSISCIYRKDTSLSKNKRLETFYFSAQFLNCSNSSQYSNLAYISRRYF